MKIYKRGDVIPTNQGDLVVTGNRRNFATGVVSYKFEKGPDLSHEELESIRKVEESASVEMDNTTLSTENSVETNEIDIDSTEVNAQLKKKVKGMKRSDLEKYIIDAELDVFPGDYASISELREAVLDELGL